MDWSKLDAGLAAALADGRADDRYVVFVHLGPAADPGGLPDLPGGPEGDGSVRTATVSAVEVAQLTERAEVRQIRLSQALGLRGST